MFCTKCGTKNSEKTKFCVKCGQPFGEQPSTVVANPQAKGENLFLSYFKDLFALVTKPSKTLKESDKFKETNRTLIYGAITIVLMMLVNLFITMIVSPITKSWLGKTIYSVTVLSHLNYAKLILLNLVLYAALIAGIAGIVCLVGLIFNKKVSYTKMLTITSLAIIPYTVGAIIISPLFSTFSYFMGYIFSTAGLVYFISLLVYFVNKEMNLKDELRVYVNSIMFFVILIFWYLINLI